jgi:PAS domain S-box-containing protein
MVGFGADGLIIEANTRAADLLGATNYKALVGQSILAYVTPEDRTAFRQAIRRMSAESHHRCTVRVDCLAGWQRELNVELAAVHHGAGAPSLIRVSLTDVTESRQLNRSLAEQRHLLELLIDHMAEALLVVGQDGRITRASQKLGDLVDRDPAELCGEIYDPVTFWAGLGLYDAQAFERVMSAATHNSERHVHEQFEARRGVFRFHVIPLRDESLRAVARLWVVQETTAEVRGRQLIEQQTAHAKIVAHLSEALAQAVRHEAAAQTVLTSLRPALDAEAFGLALLAEDGHPWHALWLGADQCDLQCGRELHRSVTEKLMSAYSDEQPGIAWIDQDKFPGWARPLGRQGFRRLAVSMIKNGADTCGLIWIARRSDHPGNDAPLRLLEAVVPLLSATFHAVFLRQSLHRLTRNGHSRPSPAPANPLARLPGEAPRRVAVQ